MSRIPPDLAKALCLQVYKDIVQCQSTDEAQTLEPPPGTTYGKISRARGLPIGLTKKWVRDRARQFAIYNEIYNRDNATASSAIEQERELAVTFAIEETDRIRFI